MAMKEMVQNVVGILVSLLFVSFKSLSQLLSQLTTINDVMKKIRNGLDLISATNSCFRNICH